MNQIRILHIVDSLDRGSGVMGVIMNYYRNIDREKVQFDFLYFTEMINTFEAEIKELGGNTYYLLRPSLNKIIKVYKTYNEFFKENIDKYKAVQLHLVFLNSFILPIAKKYGIKYLIAHVHSTRFSDKKLNALRNLLLCVPLKKQANIFFVCSKAAGITFFGKNDVESGKVMIINNAIDVDKYKFNSDIRFKIRQELKINNMFVVGHIGRFAEEKNHVFLLKVFVEIRKRRAESILVLIGDGPLYREIKNVAKTLGIEESVIFLGRKDNVEEYLQAMDVFVLPSLFEGLPLVGVEAQAAGLMSFFSNTVTKETAITNIHFLPLESSDSVWAEEILTKSAKLIRTDTAETIRKAGFDINKEHSCNKQK